MASNGIKEDPYRWILNGDVEKNATWKFGAPPNYEGVNKLFEEGRTKVITRLYLTISMDFQNV